jgi:hypothetical protein
MGWELVGVILFGALCGLCGYAIGRFNKLLNAHPDGVKLSDAYKVGYWALRGQVERERGAKAAHDKLWEEYRNGPGKLEKWPESLRNDPRVRKIEGLE